VLNEHNTVFAWSGRLCATGVSLDLPESWTQTAYQSLQTFLQASLGDRPTDRPTDHVATRSVTILAECTVEKPNSVVVYGYNVFPSVHAPTRVLNANGISIASAVFACLTGWQTKWQTDRPRRYAVGNNRRSAQWRSQIVATDTADYSASAPSGIWTTAADGHKCFKQQKWPSRSLKVTHNGAIR